MTEVWIRLKPRLLARPPEHGQVTYSLAPARGNGSALTRLNISRVILEALGWVPKTKIIVDHSPDGSKLRLMEAPACEAGDGYTLGIRGTTGTLTCRLTWMADHREAHPSERTAHVVHAQERMLIVDVPAWSRPAGVSTTPIMLRDRRPNPAERFGGAHRGRRKAQPAIEMASTAQPPLLTASDAAAEAEREGKDMLASGRSVREVARALGEDMAVVRDWKRQVDAVPGSARA